MKRNGKSNAKKHGDNNEPSNVIGLFHNFLQRDNTDNFPASGHRRREYDESWLAARGIYKMALLQRQQGLYIDIG
ncbi:hypothetical protein D3C78_1462350 [compost metagenome]